MGYDMYTVDETGESVKCDDPLHGEHYWRRNIFGAGAQADRLVSTGLGYWSNAPERTPWPEAKDYGLTYNDDSDEWEGERLAEFNAALFAMLKDTYSETPGIAVYKLCSSNDGWWVTKAECASALAIWEQNGCPRVDDYDDTIPFLRAGAAHEGFRVW